VNTLNYWLGKLNRLQLFGHGVKPLLILNETTEHLYRVLEVEEINGTVYIKIQE
jgi:hypothetical protein